MNRWQKSNIIGSNTASSLRSPRTAVLHSAPRTPVFPFSALGLLVLSLLMTVVPEADASKNLYRYVNDDGRTIIVDRVTEDASEHGYTILRADGRVVEVVPSRNEQRDALISARDQRLLEEQERRQEQHDLSLLRNYSSIADLKAAKNRALRALQVRIDILNSNRMNTKRQLEREQARAAAIMRRKGEVGDDVEKSLGALREELIVAATSIERRQAEKDALAARYDADVERLKYLRESLAVRGNADQLSAR